MRCVAGVGRDAPGPTVRDMTFVIAHRGAAHDHRENTCDAFAAAVALGADWVELDVRRSADDVLVVSHDAHLPDGRTIVETAYDELPTWVPTLAEALDACEGAKVNIEIKNDPDDPDYDADHQISDAVVGLSLAFRHHDELLVSSFNLDTVRRIRAVDADVPVGLVTFELMSPDMVIELAVAAGLTSLHPWEPTVDRRLVDRMHGAELVCFPWTVNDPDRMNELVAIGVDGIISDDVAAARKAVDGG